MKIKRIALLLLSLLLVVAGVMLVTGCDKGEAPDTPASKEIFIAPSDLPRVKYVQGQELELKGGVLTVVENGTPSKMPLDNEKVTVSGYDKNTLGKQTLTVTFDGMTTTYEIEVVVRATAENYETDYFVGDAFDTEKGRIWITKDNGSSFQVALSDSRITLKSFDNSKAGQAKVTVEYKDDEISCECSFDVTVHNVDSVTATFPKKTNYVSHETELNLKGAYLTVKAPAPSTFSKFVNMTQDMISGYEPEKVTADNREEPVTQTLTVNYAGQTFTFDVKITYSPVYLMQSVAKELEGLDFTGETVPEVSDELGAKAADAITVYLDLSSADRALVDEKTALLVARTATVYLTKEYYNASLAYEKAFVVYSNGSMSLVAESYEAIEDAIDRLEDPNDLFNYYASVLLEIRSEFEGKLLYGTTLFSSAIVAHSPESVENIIPMLSYMLKVYDDISAVPADWTKDNLKLYDVSVENAADRMVISDYLGMSYFYMYEKISSWREKNDLFDIIYTYYYYVKDNGQTDITQRLWNRLPAPGPLNEWYEGYVYAYNEVQKLQQGGQQAYLYDTAGLVYYYTMAANAEQTVKNGEVQLYKDVYALMNCGNELEKNVRYALYGYAFNMGEALGHSAIENAWEKYIRLIDCYLTDPTFSLENNAEDFEAAFDAMVELSPAELYAYISTLNFYYDSTQGTVLALDCKQYVYNTLMSLVASYYVESLPEAAKPLFPKLMNAMEYCAQQNVKTGATDDFKKEMESLISEVGALSKADRAVFDEYLGDAFEKYSDIYAKVCDQDSITFGESEQKTIDELWTSMLRFDEIVAYLNDTNVSSADKNKVTPLLFAAFEEARVAYEALSNSQYANGMYTKLYEYDGISVTADRMFFAVRAVFINIMMSTITDDSGVEQCIWNIYGEGNFHNFLAMASEFMYADFKGEKYDGEYGVSELLNAYSGLDKESRVSTYKLGINQLFYEAIENATAQAFGEGSEELKLMQLLMSVEIAYTMDDTAQLETLMSQVRSAYAELKDAEAFDAFSGNLYARYEKITA